PAALQQQLDSLQEQLRALQQGPGGGDGDGVTLLDPGNLGGLLNGDGGNGPTPFDLGGLGGIGTPPPPGSAAS
ncbi:MAG TPA: hypothetical protein VMZ00_02645, partial [Sporichthya sp.]|nr:hypothetical protein [Sporichthya sp.]